MFRLVTLLAKRRVTNLANKVPLFQMHGSDMFSQFSSSREGRLAAFFRARKRSFVLMNREDVLPQVVPLLETKPASFARKRPHSHMHGLFMTAERPSLPKYSPTQIARQYLFRTRCCFRNRSRTGG